MPVVALVALLRPAVLAEAVIVVQPLKPTVPAELAEPEPLPDQECSVEPELIEGNRYEGRQTSKGDFFVKVFGMG